MPGLIGKKIGMTSVFSADGRNVPCTVIEVGPCVVTQVKTADKDGYEALQLGFEEQKEKHLTQPELGHFRRAGVTPKRHLAEFKGLATNTLWAIPSVPTSSPRTTSWTSQVYPKVKDSRAL